ncbi:serine protease snake-like [Condylostylus longicornis]|uniref:serine protease snake-like n=1 Tax=Condylostylus longicornis TaxID=2530218 RepID=UPI00244DF487|nr:serine protease snake-like [Condylostylus longicornis]
MLFYKLIILGIISNTFELIVLQDCQISRNNEQGKCTSIHSCFKVQYDLQHNQIKPDICSFEGFEPLVCCPLNSILTQLNVKPSERISVRRCKDIYEIKPTTTTSRPNFINGEQIFYPEVVGGELTEIGEFPFMAAIGWQKYNNEIEFKCGGFLIENNFVITAAHCTNLGGAPPIVVRTGGNRLDDQYTINIPIQNIHVHPSYKNRENYNDIAILKLANNSTHTPACLWQLNDVKNYQKGTAIGYGHIQFAGKRSNDLLKVELNFYENNRCNKYYNSQPEFPLGLINSQLCAGDPDGIKDTCQGDSGGPILIKTDLKLPYIIGITSSGSGCAGQIPSIYTRISSYLDWIESIVWK